MTKLVAIFLALATATFSAELPQAYSLTDKRQFQPDAKAEVVDPHPLLKKESVGEHPVYRAEERKNEGRVRIEPVRPKGPVIKYDNMLADQPVTSTEINRIDNLAIPNYTGYAPAPSEVLYPDVPYAPGYNYDSAYGPSNEYEYYGNSPSNYIIEPDTSTFGLLWSQVPDARTMVTYVGSTISWVFSSIFVLLLGSLMTIGVCSYTNICTIKIHGVGPIHEEMRSLMSSEKLEKISHAADFVKNAIDKYQKIQKVTSDATRRRRSL